LDMNNNQTCNDQKNMTAATDNRTKTEQPGQCNNCYLAIANIPMQQWNGTYSVEQGFMRGTIFPELDLPFLGREVK
jgi:hypothetical protein